MYNWLVDEGYHIEMLRGPWTCFNASHYHALLIVDPEEAFSEKEIKKLVTDIKYVTSPRLFFSQLYLHCRTT